MIRRRGSRRGRCWVVTSYFNPIGYASRRANFRRFASRLELPLLAVELVFDRGPDLDESDCDLLVRVNGGDPLWQKERLLNLAWERLPPDCDTVAWIDCDVLLSAEDWMERADRELESASLVQPFDRLVHLRRDELPESAAEPDAAALRRSFGSVWRCREAPDDLFLSAAATSEHRINCGMAWVARRDLLRRHGLYDAMILGMGDKQLAAAAVGRAADAIVGLAMGPRHAAHYLRWAAPLAAEVAGGVGYVAGTAHHLWHGELSHRRYVERYERFADFAFDPETDLVAAGSGAWTLRDGRADLRAHIGAYFADRREDGVVEVASE